MFALHRATIGLSAEVIVVDNASTDNSISYLRPKFPQVIFIENSTNVGFARGCNMGVSKSSGDAVLFLNPDTIIAEDTLQVCLRFLDTHADAGALGVRMIDGSGRFLKESKRAFPSPLTSLFKLTGLARLFPHSPLFARYHLGHLNAQQNHEVDVLAGAFLLVRRTVLEKVGLFDETFFMYGEDVDLSYRIQKAGYKNYYIAETEIIHFKGESTRRGSLNYVRLFYGAMSLFVRKHYGGSRAALFNFCIHVAIWMRAALSAIAKLIAWVGLPVLDAVLFLLSFWMVKEFWMRVVKPETVYPNGLLVVAFPAFTAVYLSVAYYAGLYDKHYKWKHLARAAALATLVLLAGYALLPEHYRFSRGILLFGALLAAVGMLVLRWLVTKAGLLRNVPPERAKPYRLIAGAIREYEEVRTLVGRRGVIGRIAVAEDGAPKIAQLAEVAAVADALNAQELVLCSGTASNKQLIACIQSLKQGLRLRFHAAGSSSIVGSDTSTASGEAISGTTPFNLAQPLQRRLKRLIDVTVALLFLLFFPFHFLGVKKPVRLLTNAVQVLVAQKTWIGYAVQTAALPTLRLAVLTADGIPVHGLLKKACPELAEGLGGDHQAIDFWYARNWEPVQDIRLIFKNYRRLDG